MKSSYLAIAKPNSSDDILEKKDFFSITWKKVFEEAHLSKASDIHIQQFENSIRVKLRVLGELYVYEEISEDSEVRTTLINRLKAIGHFELSINDEAQDRSFSIKLTQSRYRGVVTPGVFGENFVFRIIREEELPQIKNCLLPKKIEEDLIYALNRHSCYPLDLAVDTADNKLYIPCSNGNNYIRVLDQAPNTAFKETLQSTSTTVTTSVGQIVNADGPVPATATTASLGSIFYDGVDDVLYFGETNSCKVRVLNPVGKTGTLNIFSSLQLQSV